MLKYSSNSFNENVQNHTSSNEDVQDSTSSNEDVQEENYLIEKTLNNKTTNFVDCNETFSSELQFWAITNNISNDALSKLLKLYKKYHPNKNILYNLG